MIKYIFIIICSLLPLSSMAIEPIFKLKNQSIILLNSTKEVAYNSTAINNDDFSKKNLASIDFCGKEILVTNVNVINWGKKNQSVIFEFSYDNDIYCLLFPQNIKTSYVGSKPYTRFYRKRFMDRYQNQDDSHFVEPSIIGLTYWLVSDIEFLKSKIGSKFKWHKEDKETYILLNFDITDGKLTYREIKDDEIKPSNPSYSELAPNSTTSNFSIINSRKEPTSSLFHVYWID